MYARSTMTAGSERDGPTIETAISARERRPFNVSDAAVSIGHRSKLPRLGSNRQKLFPLNARTMTMSRMIMPAPALAIAVVMRYQLPHLLAPPSLPGSQLLKRWSVLSIRNENGVCGSTLARCSCNSDRACSGSFDRTVNFAFDSAELTPDARRELSEVAKCLMDPRLTNVSIVTNGHTDGVGTIEYNLGF